MQNRTFGPYLAAINRILIVHLAPVTDPKLQKETERPGNGVCDRQPHTWKTDRQTDRQTDTWKTDRQTHTWKTEWGKLGWVRNHHDLMQ
jgi:hypothetical protein